MPYSAIGVPSTAKIFDSDITELAESGLKVLTKKKRFILLKEHVFVAVGKFIGGARALVLDTYLIDYFSHQGQKECNEIIG